MATNIEDIAEALKCLPGITEAFPSIFTDWIRSIQLSNKGRAVDITLRMPVDILKDPTDVREFSGIPLFILLEYDENVQPKRAKVKDKWEGAGNMCTILGPPKEVNGQRWYPIVFDNEEDPTWHKEAALDLL